MHSMVASNDNQSLLQRTWSSCSPDSSPPLRVSSLAYFPRADFTTTTHINRAIPERPKDVGPVFDAPKAAEPLRPLDEEEFKTYFTDKPPTCDLAPIPSKPPNFQDPYLYPTLSRNERLRLTMMWYYTQGLNEDGELLKRLQDKLEIMRELIGWEFAIVGTLDNDVFTRIAASGIPVAILPRRESTCSHTINHPPGSVLMVPDMTEDWRFKQSPHVAFGGLSSYAGTQLRCKTETGQDIAIGSVCVASNSRMETLSLEKQNALIRLADMLMAEIVTACQLKRQKQRRFMGDLISEMQATANPDNVEDLVLRCVRQVYPNDQVSIQESRNGRILVRDRGFVPLMAFQDGLWEDSTYIDSVIVSQNQRKLHANRAVRVIAYQCCTMPVEKCLIIESSNFQQVFDDVDAWFIEKCSSLIIRLLHERSIREAIEIKDRFFRGITHQFRTPIHGILGSCELLSEELRGPLSDRRPSIDTQAKSDVNSLMSDGITSYLTTIKSSGEELMATINNMLKLNRWSEIQNSPPAPTLCNLRQFESELCAELLQGIQESKLSDVSIFIQNFVPVEGRAVLIDVPLLKECLQSLLVNAVQHTTSGDIVMTISATDDYSSLRFDVVDSGCGIRKEDQQRIFTAYEKADVLSPGAGLGLTLASKIAAAMNGRVSLVWSEKGRGSHFQAEFRDPGFACPHQGTAPPTPRYNSLPSRFRVLRQSADCTAMSKQFTSYLEFRGLQRCNDEEPGVLVVVDHIADKTKFEACLSALRPDHIAICLLPGDKVSLTASLTDTENLHFFTGPFHSKLLEQMLKTLDKSFETASLVDSVPTADSLKTSLQELKVSSPTPIHPMVHALLVDDNPINLRIMRMWCEKRHIPFALAVDGQEAVDHFTNSPNGQTPNLILMDLQMPNLDGASATQRVRNMETERSLTPSVIFMVSGQDSPADKSRSLQAGANEFFVKPMKLKILDARIHEYFAS